jgi:hypothetical protein
MNNNIEIRKYTSEEIQKMTPAELVLNMTRIDRKYGKELDNLGIESQIILKEDIKKEYHELIDPLMDRYNRIFNYK